MKNMGPRRPQLPDAGFWKPPEEPKNNNEEKIVDANKTVEKPVFVRTFERPSNYGTMSKNVSGQANSTKFTVSQNKNKQAPPPPPFSGDLSRLPPRPPRVQHSKRNDPREPPVDYDNSSDFRPQMFRRVSFGRNIETNDFDLMILAKSNCPKTPDDHRRIRKRNPK